MQAKEVVKQDIEGFNVSRAEEGVPDFVSVVRPPASQGGSSFAAFWAESALRIRSQLLSRGAVLFRDFGVDSEGLFRTAVEATGEPMFDYVAGNSPRARVSQGVYTSTEYPPPYFISLHNEMSYSSRWPQHLFFCCVVEPAEGGATPLVDSRGLLHSLPGELVEEFRRKQVRYVRNLHGGRGMGKSWQETFDTREQSVVDDFAAASGASTKWNTDGSVTLINVRPATITHPETREEVWFNQADQFHPSTLAPEMYKALLGMYRSEELLPQNATYGDRSPIPAGYLDSIRDVTKAKMQPVAWRRGDLLVVDNILVAHGRMPFKGQRRILVSMTSGR